jgi:hypothetical protein
MKLAVKATVNLPLDTRLLPDRAGLLNPLSASFSLPIPVSIGDYRMVGVMFGNTFEIEINAGHIPDALEPAS